MPIANTLDDLDATITRLQTELQAARADAALGGDVLVRLEVLRDRLDQTTLAWGGHFDALDGAALDGAHSTANWLATRTGQLRSTSRGRIHLARRLRRCPHTDRAYATGSITQSHVRVILRARTPRTLAAFDDAEPWLVEQACLLTADQLGRVVELWLHHHDTDGPEPTDDGVHDRLHYSATLDGRLKGTFELSGESAITTKAILDEATTALARRERELRRIDPTDPLIDHVNSRRAARALHELLLRGAANTEPSSMRRPLVSVHTTVPSLARTASPVDWHAEVEHDWQATIPQGILERWACDSHVSRIVLDTDGHVLDVGRAARTATPAQRRALVARDGGCAIPGCDRPPAWTDAHHITHWAHGGRTDLDNLVLLCRWHHTRVHTGAITIETATGTPHFTLANDRPLLPPPRRPTPDPPWTHAA